MDRDVQTGMGLVVAIGVILLLVGIITQFGAWGCIGSGAFLIIVCLWACSGRSARKGENQK